MTSSGGGRNREISYYGEGGGKFNTVDVHVFSKLEPAKLPFNIHNVRAIVSVEQ